MGSPLYFSHPACLEHETTTGHPERPARISAIERSPAERGWLGYEAREAPAASREALVSVHSAESVDAVRSMSDRGGGAFDETVLSPGSYRAGARAAGAACAMVEALLAGGDGRVGFCATRPPGHHGRQAGLARTAAFRLLPVTDMEAGELIDASESAATQLDGFRGQPPLDRDTVREPILRFALLLREIPEIVEADLNPVRRMTKGCIVLHMRLRVQRRPRREPVKTW